jgi:hypothetical protein
VTAAVEDAVHTTEQRDGAGDDPAVILGTLTAMTLNQRRLELDFRRLGLEVLRLDATVQLMGTNVSALRDEVKQLGTYVQRLETKLDLSVERMDYHQHTIMSHIRVPLEETLHSRQRSRRHPRRPDGHSDKG